MKHVQLRLSDREYDDFREKARLAGFDSVQEAGKQALRAVRWGDIKGPEAQVPPKLRPMLVKMAEVLASGDKAAIKAVDATLDFFHDRKRPAGERPAGDE